MKEVGQWKFEVAAGETVYLRVVARETEARFVLVWLERNQPLAPKDEPYDYRQYFFQVNKAQGQEHVLFLECNFPDFAPDTARFDFWIGSDAGREFLRMVNKTTGKNQDIDIEFVVADVATAAGLPGDETAPPREGPPPIEMTTIDAIPPAEIPPGPQEISAASRDVPLGPPKRPPGWTSAKPPGPIVDPAPFPPKVSQEPPTTELQDDAARVPVEISPQLKPSDIYVPGRGREKRPKKPLDYYGAAESRYSGGEDVGFEGGAVAPAGGSWAAAAAPRPKKPKPKPIPKPKPRAKKMAKPRGSFRAGAKKTGKPPQAPVTLSRRQRTDRRIVNVGFAPQNKPDIPLKTNNPLLPGQRYFFWLEIGELIAESLEAAQPVLLPTKHLPEKALLKVVLFSFKGELEVDPDTAIGELKLQTNGPVKVVRQPLPSIRSARRNSMLFFPIRAPRSEGVHHLRCNIYCEQVLVQSRLIRARVKRGARPSSRALKSTVDYTLTHSIQPAHLAGLGAHQLSLMLNGNGNGTADLRFFGEKEFKNSASFDEEELQDLITQGREALRKATWGDKEAWNDSKVYRYENGVSFNQLGKDLAMLAKKGYAFYSHVIDRFSGGAKQSEDLATLMRKPGRVQIALKESARQFIPSALIYDYPLDNGLADEDYKICPAFQKAFKDSGSLDDADCFRGLCPTTDDNVVCPSGFWGFRHYVGMPLTLATAADAPAEIAWQQSPHLTMAAATSLESKETHRKDLSGLGKGLNWDYTENRDEALKLMKQANPHLVYFYCHGGLDGNEPYIRVGPSKGPRLTESVLRAKHVQWNNPRPLVFINGCHTTALEPEQALEFVSSFITLANAAGVIGTEITVFESLASTFAKNFMTCFIVGAKSIGESIRSARLALLKSGNPLGLVYLPFVIGTLRMVGDFAVQPAAHSARTGQA